MIKTCGISAVFTTGADNMKLNTFRGFVKRR